MGRRRRWHPCLGQDTPQWIQGAKPQQTQDGLQEASTGGRARLIIHRMVPPWCGRGSRETRAILTQRSHAGRVSTNMAHARAPALQAADRNQITLACADLAPKLDVPEHITPHRAGAEVASLLALRLSGNELAPYDFD